ncbi:MAG: 23S rRNA (adenine(2503)-C(2))-methyltransferase RlmN [Proteobacteria bacterium]|nr:23S rRNA (adenine(2503)-C(2))-methyltransferase RlmN [Pseudomonadota bacterium]
MPTDRLNFLDFDRSALEAYFIGSGHQRFRAEQLMKWFYHRGIRAFDGMSDLSVNLRGQLAEQMVFATPEVVERFDSTDGTIKWVVRVDNGNCVETVLIPENGRNTLCVSSQVGCTLDCSFCSTGKQGFNGNLSTAEIVGQVMIAKDALNERGQSVTNVVMMGMGEPLLNYENVLKATNLMMDDLAFGISKRRVTISTAGVVPAIYKLAEVTDVSLAISLHAPTNDLRSELVPLNRKYPIEALLDACRHYVSGLSDKRSLTMEYTLLAGVNDQIEHARALATLLRDVRCKVNLIPFNPWPGTTYRKPALKDTRLFQTYMMNAGYATMLRTTRGADIDAACGQLVGRVNDRTRRRERYLARVKA